MLDFAYIALSSTLVPVLRVRGFYGFTDLKNQIFLLLSALHLAASLVFSTLSFELSAPLAAFLGYLVLLTLSACWSDNVEDAIRDLPRWWCLFYAALVCGRIPLDLVLTALFVPAPFVAAYGLSQQWFRFDPCWDLMRKNKEEVFKKAHRFFSFLGNANYAAAYLVVTFFAGLHLAASGSLWWLAGLVPVWLGLGFSRCRAAWVAVLGGLIAANVLFSGPVLLVIGICCAVVAGLICMQRIESTLGRLHYIKVCVKLLRQRPWFGWGPRIFRRRYFSVQAVMNQEDPDILGTPRRPGRLQFPIGKRAHSDHFETLAESGVVGYALFAAFLGLAVYGAPDPLLAGALLAGCVNALFFYSMRTAATALPFFALAGAVGGAPAAVPPVLYAVFIATALGVLVYRMAWIPYRAGLHFYAAQTAKDKAGVRANIQQALALDPHNNMYLSLAVQTCMPEDPAGALLHTTGSLHHNDGQKVAWTLWDQFGRVAYANGALLAADAAFATALRLNPAFAEAVQGQAITRAQIRELKEAMIRERDAEQERVAEAA